MAAYNCLLEEACPNANQWQLHSGHKLNIFKREEKRFKKFQHIYKREAVSEELAVPSFSSYGRGKEII